VQQAVRKMNGNISNTLKNSKNRAVEVLILLMH